MLGGVSHPVAEVAKARGAEVFTTASAAKHSSHVIESRYVTLLNIMFGPMCTSLDRCCANLLRSHLIFKGTQVADSRKYALSVTAPRDES